MKKYLLSVLLLLCVFVLSGCTSKKTTIVGKWEAKHGTVSYVYTFRDDKTCEYNAGGTIMKCTYTTDGDKLSILYDGNTASFDTTYEIKDGKLNVRDSSGKDTFYESVK